MLFLGTAASGPAAGGAREDVLALRAADLEAQGRCDDVVALFSGTPATSESDGRVALAAARCQIRQKDYVAAVDSAGAAKTRAKSPEVRGGAELQLGIAHYHLADLASARAALSSARAEGIESPLLDLYDGLLLLQADEVRPAALALERARRGDARAVEPIASYYAFRAWRILEDEERARAALARVRAVDGDGPWVAEAERVLAEERGTTYLRPWVNAQVGLEYDSNVVLKGNNVDIVFSPDGNPISGKDDGRGYWAVDGGVELLRTENWSAGLLAGYTGTAHFDLNEFDTHYPTASGWVDRRLGDDSTVRLRYDYGYAWVDYDGYLSGHTVTASLFHVWGEAGQTEVAASGYFFDFLYDNVDPQNPASPRCTNVERDGEGIRAGVEHRYSPGWRGLELRAGYLFDRYDSDGCEYQYYAHQVSAGFDVPVVLGVDLDAWASFTYRPYDDVSAFLGDDEGAARHRDREWRTGVSLERALTDWMSVLARYEYTDTGSNTDVYDFRRHIVGAYVRVGFN